MGPLRHTLTKAERLSGKTSIDNLISRGKYFSAGCVRCCYLFRDLASPGPPPGEVAVSPSLPGDPLSVPCHSPHPGEAAVTRILVSVPKRHFKRAVKRNLLKRRIREAYRLQKEILGDRVVDLMFAYTSREVLTYEEIRSSVEAVLRHLASK